ncbi:MAG: ATP-binding protein [Alphaproteobacteria bacterium]|nr:ATP-binding protein [Alphaproteobacteria bacterium]
MKRYAMKNLEKWKNDKNHKPLIIQGARQVGKTWLMREFGAQHFTKTAYFIFEKNERLQNIFKGDLDVQRILDSLSILAGFKITPNTLILFDEIQECPEAITALKYFYEQLPEYYIIAAGSLLGVALHSGLSFPVGKVNFMTLYPLSFYEFLDAIGENMKLEQLEQGNFDILKPFHNDLIELLKKYLFIGGMPEAVLSYATEKDLYKVCKIQNEILTSYQNDFSKHIPLNEQAKLKMLWASIPTQLAKENKKFMYGKIEHGARAKEFENAIAWLEACGLIHKVYRIKKPDLPLSAYKDLAAFKIFMTDVGLLSAMSNLDARILLDKNDIFEEFKGALTEQYVLQQLVPYSDELTITYWSNESNTNEIDFVVQYENEVIPVEVKAATNLQAKSLKWYIEKYKPQKAFRFSAADYKQNEVITDYPLYAIPVFIER